MLVKSRNIIIIILLISLQVFSQNIAIGQWRDHLAYNDGRDVVVAGKKVYCIANENLFYFDTETNELVRQSKPAGFSDINATAIDYDEASNTLFIGYKSANIDLIQDGKIINMPDVYRKQTVGNKTINNVKFYNGLAYVSTGLGILVIDVRRKEVKDTYIIDTLVSSVNEVTFDSKNIYAATNIGIYKADKTSNFLSDFGSWQKMTGYSTTKSITSIAVFKDSLLANYNDGGLNNNFKIYSRDADTWQAYRPDYPYVLNSLTEDGENLIASYEGTVIAYNQNRQYAKVINNYDNPQQQKTIKDKQGNYWIADREKGLVKYDAATDKYEFKKPLGPFNNNCSQLRSSGNSVWVAPGGAQGGVNRYNLCNLSIYKDNSWSFIPSYKFSNKAGAYNFYDAMWVAPNPRDENKGFVGSFGRGLAEVDNADVINIFKGDNSEISYVTGYDYARIGGLDYDTEGNLWIGNTDVANYLVVYTKDSVWKNFALRSFNSPQIQGLIVSKTNKIWMISEQGGLIGFDYGASIDATADDIEKVIKFEKGKGSIPGTAISAVAEDLNGEIWIGSDKGISVLYSPESVFTEEIQQEAQQIKIEQDGYIQYLLESDKVTSIAVDDANRKWIGTENSGLFLVNADGTKQLEHFNIDNSPLISNNIFSVCINRKSGEVFISTEKGIMSYKGTATEGFETGCEDVLVYPNPVRPNYTGVIAMRGLLQTSDVKITDVAGNLVFQTKTLGGQAIWNGKNMKGDKAQPCVYYIMTAKEDGSTGCSSKVVIMR